MPFIPDPVQPTAKPITPATNSVTKPAEPKSVGGFLKNFVSSGANAVGGIANTVLHPIDTIKGVGNVALGAGQMFIPGEQGNEKYAKAVGTFYKDRYGSLDKIGETLYTDPVGALMDASSVFSMGGGVLSKAGQLGKVQKLAKAGETASKIAKTIDPLQAVGRAAKATVGAKAAGASKKLGGVVKGYGKELAAKALKPTDSQLRKFEELTGKPLADFIEQNKLYGPGNVAAKKADELLEPLQKKLNSMVRTDTKISHVDYANDLRARAAEIAKKDRSPTARKTVAGLLKEADEQEKLGELTDTILRDTTTSDFGNVPHNAMVDADAFNVSKEAGHVGRNFLEKFAPGSSKIGSEMSGLIEFKELAKANANKQFSGLDALKAAGVGSVPGLSAGAVTGNPVIGGLITAGIGLAAQNPKTASMLASATRGVGNLLESSPKIGKAAGALTKIEEFGRNSSRLVPSSVIPNMENDTDNQTQNNSQNSVQSAPSSLTASTPVSMDPQSASVIIPPQSPSNRLTVEQVQAILLHPKISDKTKASIVQAYEFQEKYAQPQTGAIPGMTGSLGMASPEAAAYAKMVGDGQIKLTNVPEEIRGQVAVQLSSNPQMASKASKENQKVADLATEILSLDTAPLTGNVRFGLLNPFSRAQNATTQAKLDQLKGQLAIAMRERMRGQGQISDAETRMIEKAVASLDTAQTDEAFRAELQRLVNEFGGGSSYGPAEEEYVPGDPMAGAYQENI